MEVLFENSYVRNKDLAREIYRYHHFQRKRMVVLDVLLGLFLVANLLIAAFEKTYHWESILLVPVFYLLQLYFYFAQVRAMVKRDAEVHGKEISVETVVTDSFIQNTASTGAVNKIEFGNIRSAVQTKNLILLRSKANLIYIFRKDSFTKGTKDSFILFLREKGIKVK